MGAPVLRESFLSLVSRSSGSHTVVRLFTKHSVPYMATYVTTFGMQGTTNTKATRATLVPHASKENS
jgi:hypothetical protein